MHCGLRFEKRLRAQGIEIIAGIDEAGRGPLAGPVVAAAVVLPDGFGHPHLNDSKQLSPGRREEIFGELTADPRVCWAAVSIEPAEIDTLNILGATHKAMALAVAALRPQPQHVLIDGLPVRSFPLPQTALVDGDCLSFSIAAASIVAKVTRDRIMVEMDRLYPDYDFASHKGYPTPDHLARLRRHGPCPIHRRSFAPVAQRIFDFA